MIFYKFEKKMYENHMKNNDFWAAPEPRPATTGNDRQRPATPGK